MTNARERETQPPGDETTKIHHEVPELSVTEKRSLEIFTSVVEPVVAKAVERAVSEVVKSTLEAAVAQAVAAAVRAAFTELREHIDAMLAVVDRTEKLELKAADHEKRIAELEAWRRTVEKAAE